MQVMNLPSLSASVSALRAGDFAAALPLLNHEDWARLEAQFWNASHPLSDQARAAYTEYQLHATTIWQRIGAGSARPLSVFRSTLSTRVGIETALRVLGRIFAGCNLAYAPTPPGFWRTVYSITGYTVSQCRDGNELEYQFARNLCLQLWLMAWLNPLSLVAGRLPVAVRLVGLLSRSCSYSLAPPTHAGSGLAAADLMDDKPPSPFGRLGAEWAPQLPLYVNAQSAAYAIQELQGNVTERRQGDMYEALLGAGRLAGLSGPEVGDFVKRALREFGQTHSRSIPRIAASGVVETTFGLIDVWNALQENLPVERTTERLTYEVAEASVVNHSDGGFLLRYRPTSPSLRCGSLMALRTKPSEPWALCAIRWLQDNGRDVLVGVEVINNFPEPVLATLDATQDEQTPVISFEQEGNLVLYAALELSEPGSVCQLSVRDEIWVASGVREMGEDWEARVVLDRVQLQPRRDNGYGAT